ncbi:hypothetical protein H696_00888 [Fonticula alba]|uniref:mRNA (guanine-N(7))-methyltransferase n=1 Tax=Fonticula alba TaxID=691883 RepID=A0A058ZG61_FONAL|nr:hypothetical protein H696_00888 [Fonticula alba]KCV73349.1 hypothetical protein H696_00888 [Fonticula alba]|eukprot:XP_009493050.1 hypothetical protein H696_00888 [Fonticula alba]
MADSGSDRRPPPEQQPPRKVSRFSEGPPRAAPGAPPQHPGLAAPAFAPPPFGHPQHFQQQPRPGPPHSHHSHGHHRPHHPPQPYQRHPQHPHPHYSQQQQQQQQQQHPHYRHHHPGHHHNHAHHGGPSQPRNMMSVEANYNRRATERFEDRQQSKILPLRSLNNFIKSLLISEFLPAPGARVLDLCCGKGGDIPKFHAASIRYLFGVDIAAGAVDEARRRAGIRRGWRSQPRGPASPASPDPPAPFEHEFHVVDLFNVDLVDTGLLKADNPNHYFDLVNCQFALHYAWESETKARQMLKNVSQRLKPGGYFVGTIPNADWIVKNARQKGTAKIGNDIFSITLDDPEHFGPFASRYVYFLEDAVDNVPEFLIPINVLQALAFEYGLELVLFRNFHEYFYERAHWHRGKHILRERFFDGQGNFQEKYWEASGIYSAFSFRKMLSPPALPATVPASGDSAPGDSTPTQAAPADSQHKSADSPPAENTSP